MPGILNDSENCDFLDRSEENKTKSKLQLSAPRAGPTSFISMGAINPRFSELNHRNFISVNGSHLPLSLY